jgi:PDZ domain-containing protein
MKAVFLDLWNALKKSSPQKKIVLSIILLLYIFVLAITNIKVNYQIITPGSINYTVATDTDSKDYWVVKIKEDNVAGNINTVGVYSHKQITYFQYLIAKLSPWIDISEFNPKKDLSEEEEIIRGVLMKDYSITDALIVAYEAAAKKNPEIKIAYSFQGLVVTAVAKNSESGLLPGDIIKRIDGQAFNNFDEFLEVLSANPDKGYKLRILRDGEEMILDSKKVSGIEVHEMMEIDSENTYPAYEINKNPRSIGPSGGAMMALAIYNALLEEDITKGKFIIGTGTINLDGSVGAIGGVPQKIATAAMYGADIFIIGEANYDEAKQAYEEMKHLFKPDFKLIKVKTFNDLISELEALQ